MKACLGLHRSRRKRSSWTWMRPTIRSTAIKRAASSTATTTATVTCRCTFSAASTCCWPSCGRPTSTPRRAASSKSPGSWSGFASVAAGADHPPRRQRLLPRGPAGLVRAKRRGLRVRTGQEQAAEILGGELHQMQQQFQATGEPARMFQDFVYRTRKSWSRERRVVGKAEHLAKGSNPRFVVTSLSADRWAAQALYEELYCSRGDMENRIKEQQLGLFADRTSRDDAGQPVAAVVRVGVRAGPGAAAARVADTPLARRQCDTIRLKLFKIGAKVTVSRPPDQVLDRIRLPVPHRVSRSPICALRAGPARRAPARLNASSRVVRPRAAAALPRRAPPRPQAASNFIAARLEAVRSGRARAHPPLAPPRPAGALSIARSPPGLSPPGRV